jgi:hypothetical protein
VVDEAGGAARTAMPRSFWRLESETGGAWIVRPATIPFPRKNAPLKNSDDTFFSRNSKRNNKRHLELDVHGFGSRWQFILVQAAKPGSGMESVHVPRM